MAIYVYDKNGGKHPWAGAPEDAEKRFGWTVDNPTLKPVTQATMQMAKPPGYTSPYSEDIAKSLKSISNMGSFSYDPESDEGLKGAQDEAMSGVSRAASRRNMLYSDSNKSQMGKAALSLVPQFEQAAFNKYQGQLGNLFNRLSTLSNLDTQAYNRYRDVLADENSAKQNTLNNSYNMAQLTGMYIPGFTGEIDPSLKQHSGDYQAKINEALATPDTADDALIPQLQYLRNMKIQSDPELLKKYGNTMAGIPTMQKLNMDNDRLNQEWERSESNPAYKSQLLNVQIAEMELANLPEKQKLELQQLKKQIANIGSRPPKSAADILKDEYELELYKQKLDKLRSGEDNSQDGELRQQALKMAVDPITGQADQTRAEQIFNYLKYGTSYNPKEDAIRNANDAETNSLPAGINKYFTK